MPEAERGVFGDAGEDLVAGEEGSVTIQGTLGQVGIRNRHVDAMSAEHATKLANGQPVCERCAVDAEILQNFPD